MPRIALAPMIDKTEPHFRYFIRQLFPEMWLYTEMLSTGAIINNPPQRFFSLAPCESPVALQLGSHCPKEAYRAVLIAREFCAQQNSHFAEFNLNAGCPSDRVQNRNIGVVLMNDGPLVADILAAMRQALRDTKHFYLESQPLPQITLKHRLGIEQKSRGIAAWGKQQLYQFLQQVAPFCDRLIVHARIAVLDGLNPKQNREIPPLNYPLVFRLRQEIQPSLPIELNGGLKNYQQIAQVWPHVDGVMLGRVSYENTWELFHIRKQMLAQAMLPSAPLNINSGVQAVHKRSELIERYAHYLEQNPKEQSIAAQIWPLLTVWYGLAQAQYWRRMLSPPYSQTVQKANNPAAELARQACQTMLELEHKYPEL